MKRWIALLSALACVGGFTSALHAAPLDVFLYGVTFDNAGTIVDGSHFTVDIQAQTVTNVDIQCTSGNPTPGFPGGIPATHYDTFFAGVSSFDLMQGYYYLPMADEIELGFLDLTGVNGVTHGYDLDLRLEKTSSGLTLVPGNNLSYEDFGAGGSRWVVSGVSVPEPTSLATISAGALFFLRYRRRRA